VISPLPHLVRAGKCTGPPQIASFDEIGSGHRSDSASEFTSQSRVVNHMTTLGCKGSNHRQALKGYAGGPNSASPRESRLR
jgi:hypothetical protein